MLKSFKNWLFGKKSNLPDYDPIYRKPAPPYPAAPDGPVESQFAHHLKHTLGYPDFEKHYTDLKNHPMTKLQLYHIHAHLSHNGKGYLAKSTSKRDILKEIRTGHDAVRLLKMKLDASAGRIAA